MERGSVEPCRTDGGSLVRPPVSNEWRWSVRGLSVAVISRQSDLAADLRRRKKRSIRRLNWVLCSSAGKGRNGGKGGVAAAHERWSGSTPMRQAAQRAREASSKPPAPTEGEQQPVA